MNVRETMQSIQSEVQSDLMDDPSHPFGMTQEEKPTQQGIGGRRVTHRSSPHPRCPWHCHTSPGG